VSEHDIWKNRAAQQCFEEAARLRRLMGEDYPQAAEIEAHGERWLALPEGQDSPESEAE
jgi:hypothetical protein